MATSPTQRALADLKKSHHPCQVVERWNPHAKIRQDLFGVIDLLALVLQSPPLRSHVLAVQVTSGSNHAARLTKSLMEPRVRDWLICGGQFEVWSYAKRGAKGKRKLWTRRRTAIQWVVGVDLVTMELED